MNIPIKEYITILGDHEEVKISISKHPYEEGDVITITTPTDIHIGRLADHKDGFLLVPTDEFKVEEKQEPHYRQIEFKNGRKRK